MNQSSRLTALKIEKSKAKGADSWLSDDEGTRGGGRLVVRLSSSGSKLFYFRYSIDGVRKQLPMLPFTLTPSPGKLTLEQAREMARGYSAIHRVPETRDVAAHFRAQEAAAASAKKAEEERLRVLEQEAKDASKFSLLALCEAYIAHLKAAGKPSWQDYQSITRCHITPTVYAGIPAKSLKAVDAVALLRPIFQSGKKRTASKVRSLLHAAYAKGAEAKMDASTPGEFEKFGLEVNPIASTAALSGTSKPLTRHLAPSELGAFWRHLSSFTGEETPLVVRALRLSMLLGGQRARQLVRARRVEDVSLERGEITLYDPKGRRDVARPNVLPLCEAALAEVTFLVARSKAMESAHLFASGTSHLNSLTMSRYVSQVSAEFIRTEVSDIEFDFRDLRRTAETQLADLEISKDVRAQLMSHGLSGVQDRHYDMHKYLDQKWAALTAWAAHLETLAEGKKPPSNVKRLRRA